MSTVESLYRSTLVAAALAAATIAAVPAAEAHEQGWREHGTDRGWHPGAPDRWYRHGYYRPRDVEAWRDCDVAPYAPVYYPAPVDRPRRAWLPEVIVGVHAPW